MLLIFLTKILLQRNRITAARRGAGPAPTSQKAVPAPTSQKAGPAPTSQKAVLAPTSQKAVPAPTSQEEERETLKLNYQIQLLILKLSKFPYYLFSLLK